MQSVPKAVMTGFAHPAKHNNHRLPARKPLHP